MKKEDFFSSERMEIAITNRKISNTGEKVNWLNIQKVINNRLSPFDLFIENYSTSTLPPLTISLRKKGKKTTNSFSNFDLIPLYTKCRQIKRKKYDDLMKLLKYVPEEFHIFYKGLQYDEMKSKKKRKAISSSDED